MKKSILAWVAVVVSTVYISEKVFEKFVSRKLDYWYKIKNQRNAKKAEKKYRFYSKLSNFLAGLNSDTCWLVCLSLILDFYFFS